MLARLPALGLCALALGCGPTDGRERGSAQGTDGEGTDAPGDDDSGGTDTAPTGFGPEQEYELRIPDDDVPPLNLAMTRDEVADLFGDRADEVLLLDLDSTALLTNTLDEVKAACGTAWRLDNEDPQHDCGLTELGSSFEGQDGTWRTSAEYAMVRILTMTPANVDVSGTSSSTLASLADALGIGGGYGQILSEALGIPRTHEIVSTEALVYAFQTAFVGSHPNVDSGAVLGVYLSDALSDLATMTERLGPSGDHPGLVDPSVEVFGAIFGPDFRMNAVAESNLQLVDGLDGDGGKGYLTVVSDHTGPTYDDELEFDFTDPERFSLQGILDDLRVDIRFRIRENDLFVHSCLGNPPCATNYPESPVGAGSVWGLDPWALEYNIALGAYEDYKARLFDGSYLLGTASVQLGQNGNPPGWVEYHVPLGIGSPPDDQFVWETILEVAQVALHKTPLATIGEGAADVAFTVRDIPIGLTGAQAAEAVRPFLQEQAPALSDFILGDYKKDNDRVDLFWRRGEDGRAYLHFVQASDLADDALYEATNPGFFAEPSLTAASKISSTVVAGLSDTTHEKFAPPVGESTVYFQDDRGVVYRLRIQRDAPDDDQLAVFLAEGIE